MRSSVLSRVTSSSWPRPAQVLTSSAISSIAAEQFKEIVELLARKAKRLRLEIRADEVAPLKSESTPEKLETEPLDFAVTGRELESGDQEPASEILDPAFEVAPSEAEPVGSHVSPESPERAPEEVDYAITELLPADSSDEVRGSESLSTPPGENLSDIAIAKPRFMEMLSLPPIDVTAPQGSSPRSLNPAANSPN